MHVVWCTSTAARQIEIEVAKGVSVEAAAAKFGIELFPHERIPTQNTNDGCINVDGCSRLRFSSGAAA